MIAFKFFSAWLIIGSAEGSCSSADYTALMNVGTSATLGCVTPLLNGIESDIHSLLGCMVKASVSIGCASSIYTDFNTTITSCRDCLAQPTFDGSCIACITSGSIQALAKNTPSNLAGDCIESDIYALSTLNISDVYDCTSNGIAMSDCINRQSTLSDQCASSLASGIAYTSSECDLFCTYVDDVISVETCNYCLWTSSTSNGAASFSSTILSAAGGVLDAIYHYLEVLAGYLARGV